MSCANVCEGGNFIEDDGLQALLDGIQRLGRPLKMLSVSDNRLTSKSGALIAKWISRQEVSKSNTILLFHYAMLIVSHCFCIR